MAYYLGIDLGTTGTKAMLYSPSGMLIGEAYSGYGVECPVPGWTEQDPEDWYDAVCDTVHKCTESIDRNEKVFISISAQGGALVICDVSGKPLRPAISWLDRRAGEEARFLTESHGKDYYYERTGWRLNDGYNLAEILWLKRHEPDIYGQHPLYLSPLDWLTLKLTGKAVTDYTNLGITNLEDIRTLAWLDSIFGDLGIEEAQLPDVVAAGTPLGTLCAEACADLGLPDAIAVCGGYDQYSAALGLGAASPGDIMLSTGTSWVVLGISDHLLFDPDSYISPCVHVIPGLYGAMASLETGGISIEWFRNVSSYGKPEDFASIDRNAAERKAAESGLFFIPYLAGATCPHWSSRSRGSFVGLDLSHDRYHMARAVMEGVAFEIHSIVEAFRHSGFSPSRIKMVGGASKSAIWTRIVSDILNAEVDVYGSANAACIGAAVLAAYGSGVYGHDMVSIQRMFDGGSHTISPSISSCESERLWREYGKAAAAIRSYHEGGCL